MLDMYINMREMQLGDRGTVWLWGPDRLSMVGWCAWSSFRLGEVGDCGMGLAPSMQVRQVSDRIMEFSSLLVMWSARSTV